MTDTGLSVTTEGIIWRAIINYFELMKRNFMLSLDFLSSDLLKKRKTKILIHVRVGSGMWQDESHAGTEETEELGKCESYPAGITKYRIKPLLKAFELIFLLPPSTPGNTTHCL